MKQIDSEKLCNGALRLVGFDIDPKTTEIILQITDYVRSNPDATMKDIQRVYRAARILVADDAHEELAKMKEDGTIK